MQDNGLFFEGVKVRVPAHLSPSPLPSASEAIIHFIFYKIPDAQPNGWEFAGFLTNEGNEIKTKTIAETFGG